MEKNDIYFMKLALKEAKKALKIEEVPIGCVIVDENNKVISKGYNKKEKLKDVSAHAEILAIKKASKKLSNWRLNDCTIYVTLEPCSMCASAILQARFKRVIIGAKEDNSGAFGTKFNLKELENKNIDITFGILENECLNILQDFFKNRRK